jgi:hypothetical protein
MIEHDRRLHVGLVLLVSLAMLVPSAARALPRAPSQSQLAATDAPVCAMLCLVEQPSVSVNGTAPDLAPDPHAGIHLVWSHQYAPPQAGIYYSFRSAAGGWSEPLWLGDGLNPKIGIDNNGVIHVLWVSQLNRMFYRSRSSAGIWSETADLGQTYLSASLAVDTHGGVHILFDCHTGMGCPSNSIFYLERLATGVWQPALAVAEQTPYRALATGPDGSVHIIWQRYGQGQFYRARGADGQWSDPEKAGGEGYTIHMPSMAIDPNGGIHISFTEPALGYYLSRVPGGMWTATPLPKAYGSADLFVDRLGNVYLVGRSHILAEMGTYYRYKTTASAWSEPVLITTAWSESDQPSITVDQQDRVHVIYIEPSYNYAIHYRTTPKHVYIALVDA